MELLVKVQTYTHEDPEKDASGVYKRGDIVDVRPDGFKWGSAEGLPLFVVIKVPGVDPTLFMDHMKSWHFCPQCDALEVVEATDTHRMRIVGTDYNLKTGEGKAKIAKIEPILQEWNAQNIIEDADGVSFELPIAEAIKSRLFWDHDIADMTITETAYEAKDGVHQVVVDYSAKDFAPKQSESIPTVSGDFVIDAEINAEMELAKATPMTLAKIEEATVKAKDDAISAIQAKGAYIEQDPYAKTITVAVDRTAVQEKFLSHVRQRADHILRRRKHHIHDDVVQSAIQNGGVWTLTEAEAQAVLLNKQAE